VRDVAYLMLYGNGWTQRWAIGRGTGDHIRAQIAQIGTPVTGQLTVIDPGSDSEVTLWRGRRSPPPWCSTERLDRSTTGPRGSTPDRLRVARELKDEQ
jgi:hypothetical protein